MSLNAGMAPLSRKIKLCSALMILLFHGNLALADINLSGYASIVAGRVIDGDKFLADYPKTGVYDNDWSFSPDTSLGVQFKTDINEQLDLVIQVTSNGASGYDLELDWAYISYQFNTEFSLQAGRKRLPLYYYSDFFDVGYAYYWIRPPADNYTWQISNYNGLSLLYQPELAEWDVLLNLYVGREDSEDNELLSMLMSASVDETWKNMLGFVAELSKDWIELRATYMQGELDRTVNDLITEQNVKQKFSGISANFYFYNFSILSEFNQYHRDQSDIHVDTQMLSVGYQFNDLTPHITHSSFLQEENLAGGDEDHQTVSVGLRWDFNKTTALKIQYDKVRDKGANIPVLEDSDSISLGMDLVF